MEAGPVRATVRLSFAWKGSTVREDVYLYEGDEALGLRLLVDWAEGSELLKMVVPVARRRGPRPPLALPYGAITRPSDGREEVMQRWVDVATSGGGADLRLRFHLWLRPGRRSAAPDVAAQPVFGPTTAPPGPTTGGSSRPTRTRACTGSSLLLAPHRGDWASGAVAPRRAEEHCTSFPLVTETWHHGALGPAVIWSR